MPGSVAHSNILRDLDSINTNKATYITHVAAHKASSEKSISDLYILRYVGAGHIAQEIA